MTGREVGLALAALGVTLAILGGLVASGAFGWFGRLPGDLQFGQAGDRVRVYAPLASMVVVSLLLTLVVNVIRRWFG